ncbi:MAG: DUF72 domain-containing protein [Phenylobacterium sp.]|nr:DUF72 domain-containing protein [Phenylobacterium sp.]MBX3484576.1 DUF72 domain-containing protein [Phenylobacterium sp.]
MAQAGRVRCGIGGWTFEPWRGVFYPPKWPQAKELEYASRRLTAIEINGTYYSSFKPESWAKWRAATPEGFRFAVKASRFCTNRKVLADGRQSVGVFLNQGLTELGDRLGPILWQFMPTKRFDYDDFAGFMDLMPDKVGDLPAKHVFEVRNATFNDPKFIGLCRDRGIAICNSDNEKYPFIPDITADFVYLRLLSADDGIPTGYEARDLDLWAGRFRTYAEGHVPGDFTPVDRTGPPEGPRDVYAFVIHEGKVRAPAAAQEFIKRVDPDFRPAGD